MGSPVEYLPVTVTPSNPLVFCQSCGAAVWDTDVHTRWHEGDFT